MNNIDKKAFNRSFEAYSKLECPRARERYFGKHIYQHLQTIAYNVCYHFQFSEQLRYEDVEAELLLHFLQRDEQLRQYSGNFYNVVFTTFRNKFFSILRTHKIQKRRILELQQLASKHEKEYLSVDAIFSEDIEQQPGPEPAFLPDAGLETGTAA
ncbi:hypothetical protein ADICEAN_00339 [Cesiribacter andamanensis AMV16]|uniref:RNA polymerase sigma factor, sigma-70 family n=1 Tax=Cesiribacter andamanensis AMV16 TaxID=1279009 RepID=M7NB63_9BACT|nr:hypothetical protein ADICEAN_00339 [Cesiribacter andamanensis AMV16]